MKTHPWLEQFRDVDKHNNVSFILTDKYDIEEFKSMIQDELLSTHFKFQKCRKYWYTFNYKNLKFEFNYNCQIELFNVMTLQDLLDNSHAVAFYNLPAQYMDNNKYINHFPT